MESSRPDTESPKEPETARDWDYVKKTPRLEH